MAEETRYAMGRRRPTYKCLEAISPIFFCQPEVDEEPTAVLDHCYLCKKQLHGNSDIFMYRGNTPFCSEECREEQMEIDNGRDRNCGKYATKQKHRRSKAVGSSELRVGATGTVVAV